MLYTLFQILNSSLHPKNIISWSHLWNRICTLDALIQVSMQLPSGFCQIYTTSNFKLKYIKIHSFIYSLRSRFGDRPIAS